MAYQEFAYAYDRLMEDMPYPQWFRFARECWERYGAPKTVVELGCGTGNITIPLAQTGIQMSGIDLSSDMLSIAQYKLQEMNRNKPASQCTNVAWIQQDIREWEMPQPVDSVISFCDSMNYLLEEEDILQAFRQTYQGLKAGGVFMFDVHTPNQLAKYAEQQPFFLNDDDIAYIWTCDWDPARYEIEHDLTIFVQERESDHHQSFGENQQRKSDLSNPQNRQYPMFRKIEEMHRQRAYSLEWLKKTLLQSGFQTVECLADFRWEPPTKKTQRAFFIAVK